MGGLMNRKRYRRLEAVVGQLDDSTDSLVVPAGTLAASASGRAMMADDYFTAAALLAKVATDAFTEANVDALFAANAIDGADRIKAASIIEGALALASLTGTVAKVVADDNVIGGLMVAHRIAIASGANTNYDVTLTHKTRVIDAIVVLKGAGTAGCVIDIQNVTTNIFTQIDLSSGGDKDLFRPVEVDDAAHDVAAAANLRVAIASSGGDFPGAEVTVWGFRTA